MTTYNAHKYMKIESMFERQFHFKVSKSHIGIFSLDLIQIAEGEV